MAVRANQKGEGLGRVRILGNEQIKGDDHTRLRFHRAKRPCKEFVGFFRLAKLDLRREAIQILLHLLEPGQFDERPSGLLLPLPESHRGVKGVYLLAPLDAFEVIPNRAGVGHERLGRLLCKKSSAE